ncbi:two-component system NarL family sensor kinase [Mucilaginibacter sp. UYP25]|uniref:ATP-binding protein n=1 Tax=unclassified Mucilaginibacter TaxID=2617802 RepID=UPI003393BF74
MYKNKFQFKRHAFLKFLTVIILMSPIRILAQSPHIDSLTAKLKRYPDNIALRLELANAHLKGGTIDTAQLLFTEVAALAEKLDNSVDYAEAHINIGRINADRGENVKALANYQQALTKAEKISDKDLSAHIYKHIGALYISWKKFDEALSYYEKAETLAREIDNEELVADCQNNKGTVYEQQLKYDKAIIAYKNALDVYTKMDITAKISMALSNVAIVYKFQKNYGSSLEYNLKALKLSEKTGDKWMMAATYNNIGNLYGEMGEYKNALEYCNKSIAIAKKINAIEIVEAAYESMADAAAKAGDYKNALNYHKLYATTKDKFINVESTKQLSELNVKFETERKQKLIQQQQFEITRRNTTIAVIAALFAVAIIIGIQSYRSYKLKQDCILQAAVLQQQNIATKGIIEAEEKERKRIAADLHDGVGQLFSAVRMNLSSLMDRVVLINADEQALAEKTLAMVDESCKEVRTIAHQMMPNILLKIGLASAIKDFVNKIDSQHLKVNLEAYGLEERLEDNVEIVLYRVVQECVNNVIKHSKANRLDINLTREDDNISVTIEDNGVGFNTNDKMKFEGIGLKNIITRVEYLKGTVDISSDQNKGTLIAIYIPPKA